MICCLIDGNWLKNSVHSIARNSRDERNDQSGDSQCCEFQYESAKISGFNLFMSDNIILFLFSDCVLLAMNWGICSILI